MKATLAAVFTFCFVAVSLRVIGTTYFLLPASAYEIHGDNSALEKPIDAESKVVAAEAILVGQILRYVARELESDKTLDNELDEYIFGILFGKIKDGVKKAMEVVGHLVKGVGKVVVSPIKAAVEVVKEHLTFSIEDNVMEKATKILTKIVDKSAVTYSFQDSHKAGEIIKHVCSRIDTAGLRQIEQGQELLRLYDLNV